MTTLMFKPVAPQLRRAKVLLLGEAGVGKTHAALTFPNPAVIDAEGSIDWFADRFKFVAVPTKSYADVRDLVGKVRGGATKCDTLIIDSLTSIYNGLVNAATIERQKQGSDDLRPLDWGRIKRKFSSLLDELYHQLPVHVVCVGWIKPEYAKPGDKVNGKAVSANDLVKIGETFDGDRKTLYAFDFAFKILGNDGKKTRAQVLKSRSGKLTQGQVIENFSWATLKALLPDGETTYHGMSDDEQEARDTGVLEAKEPRNGAPVAKDPPPAPDAAEAQETARLRSEIRALWKGVPGEVAAGALADVCGMRELRAVPRLKLEEFLAKSPSLLAAQQVEPEPVTAEASRETAHRALMALCSKEGVSDEVRHRIAMMRFGLESTKHLNAADLRTLRELCARYVVDAPGDAFEAWLEEVTA